MGDMLRVISLGAGVQSTTMALMAAHGEIGPMPDCAIFADPQAEKKRTYDHIRTLDLPFPVLTRSNGSLEMELLAVADGGRADGRPPAFVKNPDGTVGMLRRQCTGDYKIDVIERAVRERLGVCKGARWPKECVVEQWIGITVDEAVRMKPSARDAIRHRWPLIDLGMSRWDCKQWLLRNGYQLPPKSACIFCPLQSDAEWRDTRDNDADEWARAVAVDSAIRHGLGRGEAYLHRSCVPLDEVDLSTAEDRGQLNMFNNECEGMCGV